MAPRVIICGLFSNRMDVRMKSIGTQTELAQSASGNHRSYSDKISFTVPEACAATGLGRTSLYELITDGKLKAFKAAGRRLILRSDLEAFLASCREAA